MIHNLILFATFVFMKHILLALLLLCSVQGHAQEEWQQAFQQLTNLEDAETESWEQDYEMLSELNQQPLDLNSATRDELEALPFLTAQQVEDIMAYRYRHGELQTLGELQMIPSLDYEHRLLLQNFVVLGHQPQEPPFPRLDSLLRWGKHDVTAGTRLQFGLLGAQDAGEPFFSAGNSMGYDHYAWYLMLRRLGRIEALAVGQYRLSFGMGLVMNGGFTFGKVATLQNLGRSTAAIRPNTSRMESGYLQGAAITLRLSPSTLLLTAYGSCRPLDATPNNDGTIATLLTDGYHRTPSEMRRKHNVTQTDAGLHLDYRLGALRLGATAVYTHLSRSLQPNTQTLYRRHYPTGTDFLNASLDYRYTTHRFSLNGETAIDSHGALATINTLSYQPSSSLSIIALQRFYSYRYHALHARCLAEGGRVQNESAVYLGLTWKPLRRLQLTAYTDYAHFAWPRYLVSQTSWAWDNFLSATYTRRNWTLTARYRLHLRQRDNEDKTALLSRTEHRGRLAFSYDTRWGITLHTQADIAYTDFTDHDLGYMVSERLSTQFKDIKIDVGAGYFHTDSYDSRLYLYERAPLYQFTFPMFYGEGIRYWFMARTRLINNLTLTAKLGVTNYFDRPTIGTDKQLINHSSMTDLDLQLSYKF